MRLSGKIFRDGLGMNSLVNPKQNGKFIRVCAALLFRILPVLFLPVSSLAERLPVKTYNVADGLLRDNVTKIRQDSRGFMWFCTAEGISRFDGVGITNFTVADGLPSRLIGDFLETKSGTILIATGKGLVRLNPHGLRGSKENPLFTVFLPDNPKAEKIVTLYEDRKSRVWVGTSDGLYQLIEAGERVMFENVPLGKPLGQGGAIAEPDPNTLYVNAILEDRHGTFWIGTIGSGLFRRSPDGLVRRFTSDDKLGDNKITDLLEDRGGRLWVSMRSDDSGGVCLLDAAAAGNPVRKCYRKKDGLASNWVRDLLETSDGGLWLATLPGLCRFQPEGGAGVCKTWTAKNNLCDNIFALAEDKDGNLWTGSPCGAKKIARYGFTTYRVPDGLDYEHRVNSIFENTAGELFVSTYRADNAIGRLDGDRFSFVKPRLPAYVDYHGWGWQQTVWHDSRGAWWIPTGDGLFRSPDHTGFENLARATLEKIETGAKGEEVFRLFEDSRSDIWILITGQANDLLRWERAKNIWRDYTAQVGFSASRVGSAVVEDRHGNVWIGATSDHNDSALIRYRNGEFRVLTEAEGAPSGWIQDLFLDSRGRLWIASTGDGVWRLDEPNSESFRFVKYTPANGLTSIATACVTEDEFGRIYIGTWRGIDRLTSDTGQIENFTTADGLPASFVESAYRDRQHNLWFATDRGLVRFVPEPPRPRQPPTILITGLRVAGEPQRVSILGESELPLLDLNSGQRQITVDFLGLGASLGERLKYEYRFGDAAWTTTNERTLNFANLAAGDYGFEVRAQTADGIYSRTPAVLSFRIAAPVWQRWWFIAAVLLLVSLLIYTLYQIRLQRLLAIERTRTRIATDLHDDIGATLSKISLLSEIVKLQMTGNNAESQRLLTTIAEASRSSVDAMRDIVWAINPHRDSALEMTRKMRQYAEETFVPKNVAVRFNAPEDGANARLPMDIRRELFLIFKEAINNAARHSQCSLVEIDFRVSRNEIFLQIADDGCGFEVSEQSCGNGLSNMRARAEKISGSFAVKSEAGAGTKVEIRV
jgi:signal transduction histidine kinase/ligand-binding sensor domain-containing protein